VEVHQAEAFLAVAEQLHFGRAAEQLNMAQPPLSRLIKQLERSMGALLFERSTRHVDLTPAGRALIEPARHLVEASRAAHETVRSTLTGEIGRVRLGFAGASTFHSVGRLARTLRKVYPGLRLDILSSQFSYLALERMLDGTLDLAIGRWDFLPAEFESRLISFEEVLLAVPSTHPLASSRSLGMEELAGEDWITLPAGVGSALQNRMNGLARASGFVPRVVQTAPDSWTLVVLVGAGMGCAVTVDSVPDNVASEGVSFIPIRGKNPPLEVRMIWRAGEVNPALEAVVKVAERLFPDPSEA
jgi:DNA-binding transcriptional LysR family regulator